MFRIEKIREKLFHYSKTGLPKYKWKILTTRSCSRILSACAAFFKKRELDADHRQGVPAYGLPADRSEERVASPGWLAPIGLKYKKMIALNTAEK